MNDRDGMTEFEATVVVTDIQLQDQIDSFGHSRPPFGVVKMRGPSHSYPTEVELYTNDVREWHVADKWTLTLRRQ